MKNVMQNLRKHSQLLIISVAVACFLLAGSRQESLVALREEHHLVKAEALENMPPLIAFTTIALGGFRGLLIDFLWFRITQLQSEGKYFELVQLADWITKLNPRSADIWAFHAWNMAYNISVMMTEKEDHWRWIQHGIELLRDEGLRYNKGDPMIYRELGWIYQHKIGSISDQVHWHFKLSLAKDMDVLLGGPRPDYAALLAAANDEQTLLKRPGVPKLVDALKAMNLYPLSKEFIELDQLPPDAVDLLSREPVGREILLYHRRRRMETIFKLYPDKMQEVDQKYGPFDWRVPHTHALYWSYMGLPYAREFNRLVLLRMIYTAMKDSFQGGRLYFDKDTEIYAGLPNLELLPNACKAYEEAITGVEDTPTFQSAYEYFLKDSLLICYCYGRMDLVEALYRRLQELYPKERGRSLQDIYKETADYAFKHQERHNVLAMIEGSLIQQNILLAQGRGVDAVKFKEKAQYFWDHYLNDREYDPQYLKRTRLPPMHVLEKTADQLLDRLMAIQLEK